MIGAVFIAIVSLQYYESFIRVRIRHAILLGGSIISYIILLVRVLISLGAAPICRPRCGPPEVNGVIR